MKKLNITFCSFPDFSSNAKALYEYMVKRYNNNMNFVWIVRYDEAYERLKKINIKVYKIGTSDYYDCVKRTDVFFTTHGDIAHDKNESALYIELWHGLSLKHIGFLSDNVNNNDNMWYSVVKRKVDYFVLPSDFWRVIFSTRFNVNYNRTLNLGYPKFDYFINQNSIINLNKILNIDVKKYKKIIYYMPTYRKRCDWDCEAKINTYNILNLEKYNEEDLNQYLLKMNYLLCIKKHPSEENELFNNETDNIKIIKEEALLEKSITINEIINAADLMITDYSSLGIEFIFLNKPVIYLINDVDEYMINRGITFDNYNFWMPGYKVKKIDELKYAIDDSFSNTFRYRNEIKEKKKLWFGELKNGGCKQICDFLFDKNFRINKSVKYYHDYEEELEKNLNQLNNEIYNKNLTIKNLNSKIECNSLIINELENELNFVKNSKGWKFLEKIRKIKRKILSKIKK